MDLLLAIIADIILVVLLMMAFTIMERLGEILKELEKHHRTHVKFLEHQSLCLSKLAEKD